MPSVLDEVASARKLLGDDGWTATKAVIDAT